MKRKQFHTPKSRAATLQHWRSDEIMRAIGAVTLNGGAISGKALSAYLGVSPRGLRQMLVRKGSPFAVEIRVGENHKDEAWYKLDPQALPAPKVLPRLRYEPEAPVAEVKS